MDLSGRENFPLRNAPYVMFRNILYFLTVMGYCSVLISMIEFQFNAVQTKLAMLAISRLSLYDFGKR